MKVLNHALHRGEIYGMPPGAKYAYVYLMDVETYLHKMLVSDELKESIVKHRSAIEALLCHPSCEIIEELKFDYHLIEVMSPEGTCFKITERAFIHHPIEEKDIGKISPRMYVPYDRTTPPDPKYFRESVINSFEDPKERVNFHNKFFQCLMCGRMPQKVKKLVVVGPKDSGKTTWASVFLGIIRRKFIASITQENQFSCAMIDEDTQIIFLDEWAERTLQSDMPN